MTPAPPGSQAKCDCSAKVDLLSDKVHFGGCASLAVTPSPKAGCTCGAEHHENATGFEQDHLGTCPMYRPSPSHGGRSDQVNMETIEWYVWKPNPNLLPRRVNPARCRFGVHERGRGVGFNQCIRRPQREVGGFGFCTQHLRIVENAMLSEREKGSP